jgi:hypothetical protein
VLHKKYIYTQRVSLVQIANIIIDETEVLQKNQKD